MNILGINAFHGDSAAALLKSGAFHAGIEEERLNRIKHWAGFPTQAIRSVLDLGGIRLDDIEHLAISRDPKAHLLEKALFAFRNRHGLEAIRTRLSNLRRVAGVEDLLRQRLVDRGTFRGTVHHVEHHRAHLASTFYCSPFEEAACLTVDGFGDFLSSMSAVGRGNRLEILDEVPFPHSLGIFYTAITQLLGFPKYGDEYKVMGLAAYGEPRFLPQMREVVLLTDEGRFELVLDYFRHASEGVTMSWEDGEPAIGPLWSPRLEEVLGPARTKDAEITDRHRDLAASLQAMYEEAFFHRLTWLQKHTGLKALCLAGGCAMNSVANGKIFRKTDFRDVFIQSAAGDAGTALGAALYVWHSELGQPRRFVMEHSYWGPEFSEADITTAIREACPGFDGSVRRPAGPSRGSGDPAVRERGGALPIDGHRPRPRQDRRLVPGPFGVGSASPRQPLDPRRPSPRGNEGRPERPHQASRAVPPLRPLDPRGTRLGLLRGVLPGPVHDQGLPHPAGPPQRDPGRHARRRHGTPADRVEERRTRATGA